MNEKNLKLSESIITEAYAKRGKSELARRDALVTALLSNRNLPAEGAKCIVFALFATIDVEFAAISRFRPIHSSQLNQSVGTDNIGVGEREGRIYSDIVRRRHFGFGHGVGRSGQLDAVQPKAAGSSLYAKLSNTLALRALKLAGFKEITSCVVLPTATGMAMVLAMLTMRAHNVVMDDDARYVLWPRIDQKTCIKSILTAGLRPIVIQNKLEGEQLTTDVEAIEEAIERYGADEIFCLISTTSCFAPRGSDDVEALARLCDKHNIAHIVNNAYGVQSAETAKEITRAMRVGRVDCVISSTDKNFLVPVGGAVVYSEDESFIEHISTTYPGRASGTPTLDLCITLLSMGEKEWLRLLREREELFEYAKESLSEKLKSVGEHVLDTPRNRISIGLSLSQVPIDSVTAFGAKLFARNCSGARAVNPLSRKRIEDISFQGWGASHSKYVVPYVTMAVVIGTTRQDIDRFGDKFVELIDKEKKG